MALILSVNLGVPRPNPAKSVGITGIAARRLAPFPGE